VRAVMVLFHRWFGLSVATFLFVSGLSGAVISWDHELDAWLNPKLYVAATQGVAQSSLQLAAQVEAADPRIQVTYLPLNVEPGHTLQMSVSPRVDPATGKLFDVEYNQVAVDPVSGAIQGKRYWGAISLSRENLLPFLYKLHYSMHIPEISGVEFGVLFMGIVGIVWMLDCFISLYLSFPKFSAWRKSFAFRWRQGNHKLNFDLHRSGGVWLWLLILTLATSSVSMNLEHEVMQPVVSVLSRLTPSAFDSRPALAEELAPARDVQPQTILDAAVHAAAQKQWSAPAGAIFYSSMYQLYGVGFFEAGRDHGDGSISKPDLGNPWLYFDAHDGRLLSEEIPGTGSAGDIFLQAQFPLHSGRIVGTTGRVLVSFMGLVVAMLSITGIVIWMRKRRARMTTRIAPQPFAIASVSDRLNA
jgi:uncharacterized iron-regulated membrane protein